MEPLATLPHRRLGAAGPEVGPLGLGTMAFAGPDTDPDDCVDVVHAAVDRGLVLVDTADAYGDGRAEEVLGRALVGRRDRVVLATKVGLPMTSPIAGGGLSPAWIETACEQSLRRLGTDHVDLYQLHRPDPTVAVEDTVEAVGRLIERGLVRHWGTSVLTAPMLREICEVAEGLGVPRPVSDQLPYSLLVRSREREVLPACAQLEVGAVVWSPLNGGWLTGKYRPGAPPPEGSRGAREGTFVDPTDETKLEVVGELTRLADEHGCSLPALALARVAGEPGVATVLLGPRTRAQLDELLDATATPVPDDAIRAIDSVVHPGTTVDPRNDAWPDPAELTRRTGP